MDFLLLDARNNDDLYLIAYDDVYEYADETSSTFQKYQLTYQAVWIGGGEIDIARVFDTQKLPWMNGIKLLLKMGRMVVDVQSIRLNVLLMKSSLLRLQMKRSSYWGMKGVRSGMRTCIWRSEFLVRDTSQGATMEVEL